MDPDIVRLLIACKALGILDTLHLILLYWLHARLCALESSDQQDDES